MDKLTIIKVGGKVVENEKDLSTLLSDFSKIAGYKILVHGGGRTATKIAEKLGIESKMVNGRRITDAETLKITAMVYAGLVNKNVVAKLQALDLDAIGLCGADMNYMRSIKRPVKDIDYGFVGDVKEVDGEKLANLINNYLVPVLAPITHDKKGQLLNTNADTIASETAKALSYYYETTLIYCFEKKGVLLDVNNDESVIPELNYNSFQEYSKKGLINEGMIPKLENSFQAIKAGVKNVIITRFDQLLENSGTIIK